VISKEAVVQELCRRWQVSLPEMAIRAAISEAFPELASKIPPVNVRALAARRGVISISESALNCDGVISVTPSGAYSIEVNRDHPEVRQRFTIAHEIGHTFFFELDGHGDKRYRVRDSGLDRPTRSSTEEQLCNFAAAELLMPYDQFAKLIRETGPTANRLRKLARTFNVSLQAAARRAAQTLSLNITVALWEYQASTSTYETSWLLRGASGKSPGKRELRIKRADPGFHILHSRDQFRGRMWVSLGGQLDDYFVDAAVLPQRGTRSVLTVFVLEKNPSVYFKGTAIDRTAGEQLRLV
jgi:Zn-dependent peptidase ImmA (M78 family)